MGGHGHCIYCRFEEDCFHFHRPPGHGPAARDRALDSTCFCPAPGPWPCHRLEASQLTRESVSSGSRPLPTEAERRRTYYVYGSICTYI